MPLDGNLAAAHARSVEHFANVAHLGARTGGEIRLVELEEHVGEVDDDATIGLAHVEVSPLELLDELAIAGELLIARIELLIPRLELIADDGPAEPTERAANGSSGCGVAGRVPGGAAGGAADRRAARRVTRRVADQRTRASAESAAAKGARLSLTEPTGGTACDQWDTKKCDG